MVKPSKAAGSPARTTSTRTSLGRSHSHIGRPSRLQAERPSAKNAAAMSDLRQPAIRVTMMPRDTNHHGTIFGGVLLSYIDQAGAVAASLQTKRKLVTVAMREVVFHEPVKVGDLVSFYGEIIRIGNTSVTVKVTAAPASVEPSVAWCTGIRRSGDDSKSSRQDSWARSRPSRSPRPRLSMWPSTTTAGPSLSLRAKRVLRG